MKENFFLTLSIVSHGDAEKIAHLLDSIQKHEPNIANRFQLILTDNLGADLPDIDPSPWASFQLLRNQRPLGFAENHNRAFERARGEYFAILNPDLVFDAPVFETLLGHLQAYHADLVAPQIVDKSGAVQDSYRPLPTPLELLRRRLPGYTFQPPLPNTDGMIHPDWIAGMFWLWRSESYRQLGGMDARYRLYFEDVDICTRARQRRMKIMVTPQVRVRHDAQRSSRRSLKYLFIHFQSAVKFFVSTAYRQERANKDS